MAHIICSTKWASRAGDRSDELFDRITEFRAGVEPATNAASRRVLIMKAKFALMGLAIAISPAFAGVTAGGKFEFNILNIQGLVGGSTFTVDAKFAQQHKISVPAPFSAVIPASDAFQTLVAPAPKPGDAIVKFTFASADGKRLLESVQMVPMTLPMLPRDERLNLLAKSLAENEVQKYAASKQNVTRDVVRQIKVGPYDAVEVMGTAVSQSSGLMFYRLVGVVNPKSDQSVVILASVVDREVKVPAPDDMTKTRSGAVIQTFRFLD